MRKGEDGHSIYINKVRENTRRYLRELLSENENLRTFVSTLEGEKLSLQEQCLLLREEINRNRKEQVDLQERLSNTEAANQRFLEQYLDIEQQNNNLANLYVASYRLHGTLDRQEVLSVIQEIIINMIGSEEIAIFELNEEGSALSLAASFGIEPTHYQAIPLGSGLIGSVALTGETYMVKQEGVNGWPEEDYKADLTACLSLKIEGKLVGAIAIFRLLQQKAGLEPVDYELLDLLAKHAAMALYSTGLHARFGVDSIGVV